MFTRRVRGTATAVLAVLAAVAVAVLATLADGRAASQAQTHDGGAWLVNRGAGYVAHVNYLAGEITGAVRMSEPGAEVDVEQAAGVIAVHNRNETLLTLLDAQTFSPMTSILTAEGDEVHAVAGGVVVVGEDPVRARRFDIEQVARLEAVNEHEPVLLGAGPGLVVVDLEDRIVLLDEDGTLQLELPDGITEQIELGELGARPAQLTVVGTTVVALTEAGELFAVDGEDVRRLEPEEGPDGDWVLQQPSPTGPEVVAISPDGELRGIDLRSGAVTRSESLPGGLPLAPIVHGGCQFSVVLQPPVFSRICGDEVTETDLGTEERTPTDLRLRLVNGWVWVNDIDVGTTWVTDRDDDISMIDDWDIVLGVYEGSDDLEIVADGGAAEQRVNPEDAELVVNPDLPDLTGPNEPPIARPVQAATREDRPVVVDVLANDEDPNGDVLLVSEVDNRTPQTAVVEITGDGSAVQVVPAVGFTGTVRFAYTVTDGRGGSDSAEVTVDVTPMDPERNRPPEPVIDVVTVRAGESVTLNVLSNDRDPDGDRLALLDVEGEGVTIRHTPDGTVTLTPDPDQEGRVDLTYTVADEFGATAQGRILVEVRLPGSNRAPIARNVAAQTLVERRIVVDLLANDDDPDGDRLLVQAQPELLFAPDGAEPFVHLDVRGMLDFEAEQAGTYVLAYTISDGSLTATALVRIEVSDRDTNRPPVAVRDDVTIPVGESRIVPVLRNDHDPDGDVISLVDWEDTDGLRVEELERDRFRVTALPGATPASAFRYSISDGVNEPVGTTVSVLVVDPAQPLPPVAVDDEVEVRAGQVSLLHVLDNDYDPAGGDLQIVGVSEPDGVEPVITADSRSISLDVPDATTQGFTLGYEIANERGDRAAATVRVRIVPDEDPNRAPIAATDIARTIEGQPVVIDVLANDRDPDGDPIELEGVARQPANGTATMLEDRRIAYVPDEDFGGTDRFAYTIVDARGAQATGEVLVGVVPVWPENRPPEAQDDEATAEVGGDPVVIDVLANDRDPDGDPLTVVAVTSPAVGEVGITQDGLAVVYRPPGTVEEGRSEVAFAYTVDDGRGGQDQATVTVTLILPDAEDQELDDEEEEEELPDPPVAVDDRVGPVPAGESLTVAVLDNDLIPDQSRAGLTLTANNPAVSVTPARQLQVVAPEQTGTYRYTITDEHGRSSAATLTVVVQPNQPPVVRPLTLSTAFETPVEFDLTRQASDPDGDDLYFVCCDNVRGGSVTNLSPDARTLRVRFQPNDGFAGQAGFAYTVDDQQGHRVAGAVTVTVEPRELEPPVANSGDVEVEAGGVRSLDLRSLVSGPHRADQLDFSLGPVSGQTRGPGGVMPSVAGSTLRLDAGLSAAGSRLQVTYRVVDILGQRDEGIVQVEAVSTSAPLPVVRGDTARTVQGEPVLVRVLDNDVGDQLRVVDANGSPQVAAVVGPEGQFVTLTPAADFFGTSAASYVVRDRYDDPTREVSGRIELTVIGRPDAPSAPQVTSDSGQATLVWGSPASNGASITGFEVEHDQGGRREIEATSTLTWTGLTNGTTYRFRVRAVNEAGEGEFGPWSSPTTPDQVPGRSGPPQVRFGDGELHVTWQAPPNEGSPITRYVLEIGGATTGIRELPPSAGSSQSYTWSNLPNGANHTFRVKAVNAADEQGGDFSAWSEPEHPLTRPSSPGVPTLEGGPNYLEVTWSRPADGGDAIQAYEIQIDGESGRTVRVNGATTTTYRWANLTNGVNHRFRVRAWNRDERGGQWSSFSAFGRACDVPGQPAAPTATRGDRSADLTWSAPATNGCEILGYDIATDPGGTSAVGSHGTTSANMTNLINGTSYTFRVRAFNEQGEGSWSSPSNAVVPAGPPLTTSISGIDAPAPGELRVSWGAADNNGAAIQRYELSVNNGPAQSVGTGTQHTLTGLSPGTSYSIRVRAVNEVGAADWSAASSATAEGVPSQVGGLSVSAPSRGTLRWTWSAPSNNGSSISRYEVDRSSNGSSLISTTSRSHTWDGLGDNTTRDIRVRACNRHGCGSWSSSVSGTTQSGPPPPVTITGFGAWLYGGGEVGVGWTNNPSSGSGQLQCQYRIDGVIQRTLSGNVSVGEWHNCNNTPSARFYNVPTGNRVFEGRVRDQHGQVTSASVTRNVN